MAPSPEPLSEVQCLTPGAKYRIDIHDHAVYVIVDLPAEAQPSSATAASIEDRLHRAVELALSPLWSQETCS